ncbi:alpha-amylase family glycosyl hydrolase [Clostridium sp. BJN0001]|uniref:alpha-amylase family glycosyl hydrolase n=1 Tax=Clostridium sp. BJN0001 TaxID=2930219 RepID=UPI001FD519BF|nr:alpha-amylase family glycosyl hydrolase [Clostridium sp. BJN0001]
MIKKITSIFVSLLLIVVCFCGCGAKKEYTVNKNPNNENFSWDNATVYFELTDRFLDGDESNNHSYGRELDQDGNEYSNYKEEPSTFHGGDLKGLTKKINEGYFNDLGVNALWISCPFEQVHGWVGADGFKFYSYHGYWTLDYTNIDANMGTKEDFKEFVDTAHEHGIRVVLDVILNHPGYATLKDMDEYGYGKLKDNWKDYYFESADKITPDSDQNYMDKTDEAAWQKWFGSDWVRASQKFAGYDGSINDPDHTKCLSGLPDFKTESTEKVDIPQIWKTKWNMEGRLDSETAELNEYFDKTGKERTVSNYIIKEISDWVRNYGIDGFRCDTAKHVEQDKWKDLKEECTKALKEWKENNPDKKLDDNDFWMTGEVYGQKVGRTSYYDNGFDSLINFEFQNYAGNIEGLDNVYSSYAKKINNDSTMNALSYISSHDTILFDRDNLINAGSSLLLVPGAAQIYYGDETGRKVAYETCSYEDQRTRGDMNWDSINEDVLKHFQKLGRFRNAHIAVGAGEHQKISDSPYTFSRVYDKDGKTDKVVCVLGAEGKTEVDVSSVFSDGETLVDAYTGNTSKVKNGKVKFKADKNGVILIEEE